MNKNKVKFYLVEGSRLDDDYVNVIFEEKKIEYVGYVLFVCFE